jgi:hypothetical protein
LFPDCTGSTAPKDCRRLVQFLFPTKSCSQPYTTRVEYHGEDEIGELTSRKPADRVNLGARLRLGCF